MFRKISRYDRNLVVFVALICKHESMFYEERLILWLGANGR